MADRAHKLSGSSRHGRRWRPGTCDQPKDFVELAAKLGA
jgi:hypothetical protein